MRPRSAVANRAAVGLPILPQSGGSAVVVGGADRAACCHAANCMQYAQLGRHVGCPDAVPTQVPLACRPAGV